MYVPYILTHVSTVLCCPPPSQPNHQLLGPKPFPLDRLMAIFYSILEEDVPPAAHLYSQVRRPPEMNALYYNVCRNGRLSR